MQDLVSYRRRIQPMLSSFFDDRHEEIAENVPQLLPLFRLLADYAASPGKCVRGFLVTVGYAMIRGRVPGSVYRLSLLAELIHASLLIHDDIIDRDETRRGIPTLHTKIARLRKGADSVHYGNSQALLLGSILGIWAREHVLASPFAPNRKMQVLERVERLMAETHYGQMLDVQLARGSDASPADVLKVYMLKTAAYTFEAPLHIGAMLAGASKKQLAQLSEIALPIGVAFQIQDDILGMFGSAKEIGKPVTSDLAEGKQTILVALARTMLPARSRKRLETLLRTGTASRKDLSDARHLLVECGAKSEAEALARILADSGIQQLTKSGLFDITGKRLLASLARFSIRRNT